MSAAPPEYAHLLAPPDDATVNRAIDDFAQAVREAYGERVKGIYLFGSRARGDHTPESDADIVVVLEDEDWDYWREKFQLADLEYDIVVETGADVQGWPVRESEWIEPQTHRNPALVRAMQAEGRPIVKAS
jgi:predicted nucleotidyltransferase